MFSLDENFASERVPLAHLAIKGKYDDMECMCREASVILGIIKELQEHSRSGKHVLKYALSLAGYNLGSSFLHYGCRWGGGALDAAACGQNVSLAPPRCSCNHLSQGRKAK